MEFPSKGSTSRRSQIRRTKNVAERPAGTVYRKNQSLPTSTAGEVLSDGSFVELIRDGARDSLLRWISSETSVGDKVTCGNARYTPTPAASLIRHLPAKPV